MAAAVSVDEQPQGARLGRRRHHALLEPTPELHVEPTHATRHAIELKVDAHFKPARETT